jgi:hypothetical protein
LATDLAIGFVKADRGAMGLAEWPQALLDEQRIGQGPAADRAMIGLEAPVENHVLDIPVTQRIAPIPGNYLNDQLCLEIAFLEAVLRLAPQFLGNGIEDQERASKSEA